MEKEKKSFNLITIIFLGIVIGLVIVGLIIYCLNAINKDNKNNTTENSITTVEDALISDEEETIENSEFDYAKIYPDKDLVFSKEYVYYNGEEESYSSLDLLVINLDFEEIRKINSKIEDFYNKNKALYPDETENLTDDNYIELPTLYYDYTLVDGILDVVIYYYENYEYLQENYHIDIEKEKILSNEEFLNELGIGKENLEELINDSFLENYFYESSFDEFNKIYKNFEEFKNDIKYTNIDNKSISEKYEYNFEKICNFCNITYRAPDRIIIDKIFVPSCFGTDAPSTLDNIIINLNRKYVFLKTYGYRWESRVENESLYISNKMPIINLNSNDANKVNKELEKFYNDLVKLVEKNGGEIILGPLESIDANGQKIILEDEVILNKDGKVVIDNYYTMNFAYTIINDKVLSIVVEEAKNKYSLGVKSSKNLLYNFDIETGKLLTNEEYIEMCGVELENFKEKLDEKLMLTSNNKDIEYDINNLQITFEDPGKLFYLPENKANTYDGHLENELGKFVALGENFPNYPYTWITFYLDSSKDTEAVEIKNKQSALDKNYINDLIDSYDENNKCITREISDEKQAQYYLIDFQDDEQAECIINYDSYLYAYCKGYTEPTLIDWEMEYTIYEVENEITNNKRLILENHRTNGVCFEAMSISSIEIVNNQIVRRNGFGYHCDTEKENDLREKIYNDDTMDVNEKNNAIKSAHSLKYYYNTKYYDVLYNTNTSSSIIAINESKEVSKEEYEEHVKNFKNNHKLIFKFN